MLKVGDSLPDAMFYVLTPKGPQAVSLAEWGRKGKVVVFGVPGAFTPTCSQIHLPGFVKTTDAFTKLGVSKIGCLSVNDPFVMEQWGKEHQISGKIEMLADGNGDVTRAFGLELDLSKGGLGMRCQRFALYAENGVVKVLEIEPTGSCTISSADSFLKKLQAL